MRRGKPEVTVRVTHSCPKEAPATITFLFREVEVVETVGEVGATRFDERPSRKQCYTVESDHVFSGGKCIGTRSLRHLEVVRDENPMKS